MRSVDKHFDLYGRARGERTYLFKRKLARYDETGKTEGVQRTAVSDGGERGLRACVESCVREFRLDAPRDAEICYDQCVSPLVSLAAEYYIGKGENGVHLALFYACVYGYMCGSADRMAQLNRVADGLPREIFRSHAVGECRSAEVDRVSTACKSGTETFLASRGGEQLGQRFVSHYS